MREKYKKTPVFNHVSSILSMKSWKSCFEAMLGSNLSWFGRKPRIPLMTNFFEKSLTDRNKVKTAKFWMDLKEVSRTFKPQYIFTNGLQSKIDQPKALKSVCPTVRLRHVRLRNDRLYKTKKWSYSFSYLLLGDEVWRTADALEMFFYVMFIDSPIRFSIFNPKKILEQI